MLIRDGFRCVYCGVHPGRDALHVDHVHPRSERGSDDETNLVTACQRCNNAKGGAKLIRPAFSISTTNIVGPAVVEWGLAEYVRRPWLRTVAILAELVRARHFWRFGGFDPATDTDAFFASIINGMVSFVEVSGANESSFVDLAWIVGHARSVPELIRSLEDSIVEIVEGVE